ncbi:MAG: TonB-dependent receptor, partial [Panacagrimonas sp.]
MAAFLTCVAAPMAMAQTQSEDEASQPTQLETIVVEGRLTESDSLSLDENHYTGSRLGLSARELPASVSVVTREMIQIRGARTAMEAIESAVGMSGGTSVGSIPNYATRGFTGNDITVMRDGIRQNTASQSARPLDAFLFDRIEVLKGPASLMYGEGAVGGAVNYVSKSAPDTHQGQAQVSVGSWDTYRAAVGTGGPTGVQKLYFRADASTSRSGGYVNDSESRYDAIAGELRYQHSADTSLRFSASLLDDETQSYYGTPLVYDAVIGLDGVEAVRKASAATDRLVNARIAPGTRRLNYNNADNFAEGSNSFWRLIADTRLSPQWTLRNEIYAATQRLDWRNTESTVWNPGTQLVDRASFFLIYRDDLQLGNRLDLTWSGTLFGLPNKFLVGGVYDRNDQDRNSGQPDVPASPTPASVPLTGFDPGFGPAVRAIKTVNTLTKSTAVYVEDVLSLTDSLKLIGGLRYDHIEV